MLFVLVDSSVRRRKDRWKKEGSLTPETISVVYEVVIITVPVPVNGIPANVKVMAPVAASALIPTGIPMAVGALD